MGVTLIINVATCYIKRHSSWLIYECSRNPKLNCSLEIVCTMHFAYVCKM